MDIMIWFILWNPKPYAILSPPQHHPMCQLHSPNYQILLNVDVCCFIERQILSQNITPFGVQFTGLKMLWRTKNYKYEVWSYINIVSLNAYKIWLRLLNTQNVSVSLIRTNEDMIS